MKRWFQLHLSTALAMMFLAAGGLGLNLLSHCDQAWTFYFDSEPSLHKCVIVPAWPIRWRPAKIYEVDRFGMRLEESNRVDPTGKNFGASALFQIS